MSVCQCASTVEIESNRIALIYLTLRLRSVIFPFRSLALALALRLSIINVRFDSIRFYRLSNALVSLLHINLLHHQYAPLRLTVNSTLTVDCFAVALTVCVCVCMCDGMVCFESVRCIYCNVIGGTVFRCRRRLRRWVTGAPLCQRFVCTTRSLCRGLRLRRAARRRTPAAAAAA